MKDESGTLLGRVGLDRRDAFIGCGALVLHGVRCGGMPGLLGVALARQNNRDARRTEAPVAGSLAAWSEWAEQVLAGQPDLEIERLLQLHPLLRDHELPVWRFGAHALTLNDLIARIVASDELRVHLGDISHEDDDDMSRFRFAAGFKLSIDLVTTPKFRPGYRWSTGAPFPWFLGVAAIDYKSRLEVELTRVWGGFEEYDEDDAVIGDVDGIEIRRSVTVYRRVPTV